MPDVAVVIPAYKAAGHIARAIDSTVSQIGVSIELIVIDDACPEDTGSKVQERYGHLPYLQVIRLPQNAGPATARNAGIRACRSTWVAVLDADDAMLPGRLQRLIDAGRQFGADAVADNVLLWTPSKGQLSPPQVTSIQEPTRLGIHDFLERARPDGRELDYGLLKPVMRRAFLQHSEIQYPEAVRHGEDYLLYVKLLNAGGRFLLLPEPGYLWTVRTSGMSRTAIDYDAQINAARALHEDPAMSSDTRAKRLLNDRAKALKRFSHRTHFVNSVRSRRWVEATRILWNHPSIWLSVYATTARRLRTRRGESGASPGHSKKGPNQL